MRHINKKLAVTTAAVALLASLGAAVAQNNPQEDPMATPQTVTVDGSSGQHIYFFRDQGNSPETDPAAHLMLIKHEMPAAPVAETTTTTTTTVAQATTAPDPVPAPAPMAADTSATDTVAAPVDTTPALAPRADRN